MSGLFVRNFEHSIEEPVSVSDDAKPVDTITLVEAEIMAERARNEAFEKGRLEGATTALTEERTSREARSAEAIQALSQYFREFASRDKRMRSEMEVTFSELILGVGERILPDIFDTHIGDLLIARTHSAIHRIVGTGRLKIRVPPELADSVIPRLNALAKDAEDNNVAFETFADPQIEDGTIQIDWCNGTMEYDPGIASLEVLETLKEAILELRAQLESAA